MSDSNKDIFSSPQFQAFEHFYRDMLNENDPKKKEDAKEICAKCFQMIVDSERRQKREDSKRNRQKMALQARGILCGTISILVLLLSLLGVLVFVPSSKDCLTGILELLFFLSVVVFFVLMGFSLWSTQKNE